MSSLGMDTLCLPPAFSWPKQVWLDPSVTGLGKCTQPLMEGTTKSYGYSMDEELGARMQSSREASGGFSVIWQ